MLLNVTKLAAIPVVLGGESIDLFFQPSQLGVTSRVAENPERNRRQRKKPIASVARTPITNAGN